MRAARVLTWCCAFTVLAACGSEDDSDHRSVRKVRFPDAGEPREVTDAAPVKPRGSLPDGGVAPLPAAQPTTPPREGAPAAPSGNEPEPAAGSDARAPEPQAMAGAPAVWDPRIDWPTIESDAGTDDDAGVAPPPSPRPTCNGKPGAPGDTTRMYNDRQYIVHIPKAADPNAGLPIMFVYHGAGGKGADMQFATNFDALADLQNVITVYPTGQAGNAPWNVGRNVCAPGNLVDTNADDTAYFNAMLDAIERDQCLDRERVFVTGFSMGGYYSNEIGCQLGRARLRAIAPHSGGTHSGSCNGGALPVLLLHGDSDGLINYRCGTQARDYWVDRNGCSPQYDTWDFTGGQCAFHRDCPRDAPVVLCTFHGMDHTWAYPPMWESSSVLIWAFFAPMF